MKKYLITISLVAALFALGFTSRSGFTIQPTYLTTPGERWETINDDGTADTITASQATFAVNARDYSTVMALAATKTITWDVPNDASGVEFRFQTKANGDIQEIEMWVASGDYYRDGTSEEQYMLGGTFTLAGGQQVAPNSNVFCDTCVATEMIIDDGEVRDSGNDRVSVYKVDLRGYKKVVFIATTFQASTTIYIDTRWY